MVCTEYSFNRFKNIQNFKELFPNSEFITFLLLFILQKSDKKI